MVCKGYYATNQRNNILCRLPLANGDMNTDLLCLSPVVGEMRVSIHR
jgi:hypothetical protein